MMLFATIVAGVFVGLCLFQYDGFCLWSSLVWYYSLPHTPTQKDF
jgi:hypothetical protein